MTKYIEINSPKIELCFTKSNKLGSRIIRSVLGEPVSHVCFMIENSIIHSNFSGTHVDFKKRYLKENTIMFRISLTYEFADLQSRLEHLMQDYAKYDWSAFAYFSYRALLRKLFGIPLPQKNLLNQPKSYLCTEFATMVLNNYEHGIITPYQLYLKLKEGGHDGRILH